MKLRNRMITMFVLIGVLFLGLSSVYAETAEEYFKQGFVSYGQGNFTQAISDYTKAIEINPNSAETYSNRGNAYGSKGDYDKAILLPCAMVRWKLMFETKMMAP